MIRGSVLTNVFQPDRWSTRCASNRLRVKTAVGWLRVFVFTVGAHWEGGHCRIDAIVGNLVHNREAGPTVSAIGEWIAVTSLSWIEHFLATFYADGCVRRNAGAVLSTYTLRNAKVFIIEQRQNLRLDAFDL